MLNEIGLAFLCNKTRVSGAIIAIEDPAPCDVGRCLAPFNMRPCQKYYIKQRFKYGENKNSLRMQRMRCA